MAFNAAALLRQVYCLDELSKDVEGQVLVINTRRRACSNPACESLTLVQELRLTVRSNMSCDSKLGGVFDGQMQVQNLTTVFTGSREGLRGLHAADFLWTLTGGGSVAGTLEGITNAGIVRPRCERCDQGGILTGHLFGTGSHVPGIPVPDFNVDAIYRLVWDPIAKVGATAPVAGTLEGRPQR